MSPPTNNWRQRRTEHRFMRNSNQQETHNVKTHNITTQNTKKKDEKHGPHQNSEGELRCHVTHNQYITFRYI